MSLRGFFCCSEVVGFDCVVSTLLIFVLGVVDELLCTLLGVAGRGEDCNGGCDGGVS
jgi:hypothetical protein